MNNPLGLLIVEDSKRHISEALKVLGEELPRLPIKIEVTWVTCLDQAKKCLLQSDMVMSAIFFPATRGGDTTLPCGKALIECSLEAGKPIVWLVDSHSDLYNAPAAWGRKQGVELLHPRVKLLPGSLKSKPWKEALYGLLYLTLCLERGFCVIQENRLWGQEGWINGSVRREPMKLLRWAMGKYFSGDDLERHRSYLLPNLAELGFPRN